MLKYLYLAGALITSVIILIVAFGNIQAICVDMMVFFSDISAETPPTILIFWVAGLGVATGFFYHGLLHELFSKKDEDDDDDF